MPNWNDPKSIREWLEKQPKKPARVERPKPAPKPAPKASKPAPKENAWRRNLEETKPPPRRIGPEAKSSYRAPEPERSDAYHEAWRRPDEHRKLDPDYSPYTNYQALPEFVTRQRRNPAGGIAGIRESKDVEKLGVVGFGSASPAWNYHGRPPTDAAPEYHEADTYYDPRQRHVEEYHPDYGDLMEMENPPWGHGPTEVQLDYMRPNWRPEYNLWRRIRDADIVPYGQNVPLGQQMRPSFGPKPYSGYFDLSKYNFDSA
jgi:hypothetical protein